MEFGNFEGLLKFGLNEESSSWMFLSEVHSQGWIINILTNNQRLMVEGRFVSQVEVIRHAQSLEQRYMNIIVEQKQLKFDFVW